MGTLLFGCCAALKLYSTEIILLASAIIAYIGLVKSSNSYKEHNRPYITFNLEPGQDPNHIVLAIRNTGNRGANDVCIKITPPLKSVLYHSGDENDPVNELSIPFISPGQEIVSHFDHKHLIVTSGSTDHYDIGISYEYRKHRKCWKHWNCRKFKDSYIVDLSYIGKIHFTLKPKDWGIV
ncbi:MAG: hypothetical protein LHW56_09660 [Candidatus Cloacimonetes bacterium]|nr:hypothetical protein [Candidatus Cloacimonadota bacterium]MDY0173158.1 hypothetical protein [Candidatus Cloacimonadaceae bacterium]